MANLDYVTPREGQKPFLLELRIPEIDLIDPLDYVRAEDKDSLSRQLLVKCDPEERCFFENEELEEDFRIDWKDLGIEEPALKNLLARYGFCGRVKDYWVTEMVVLPFVAAHEIQTVSEITPAHIEAVTVTPEGLKRGEDLPDRVTHLERCIRCEQKGECPTRRSEFSSGQAIPSHPHRRRDRRL